MKIIISTKLLGIVASKAIRNKSYSFSVSEDHNKITFLGTKSVDFSVQCLPSVRDSEVFCDKFIPIAWLRIKSFVRLLPEQPVVVCFSAGQIKLEQFVMIF